MSDQSSAAVQYCKGCGRALTGTYLYVYVEVPIPPGSELIQYTMLDGPFCDDCANRKQVK